MRRISRRVARQRVKLHHRSLVIRERPGLLEKFIRNVDLPDVVQDGRHADVIGFLLRQAQLFGDRIHAVVDREV